MDATLEDLRRQERAINQRIGAIQDAARFEENKAQVGKCFRYRNCYSCPEKPGDYWWLYAKVQSIAKSGHLTVFMFQTDKYGEVTIKIDKYRHSMNDGYQPIAREQFDKQWRNLKRRIAACRP